MNFKNKITACRALGNEKLFAQPVVEKYLQDSTYPYRRGWIKKIQEHGQTAHYAVSPNHDFPEGRRETFKEICLIQLQYMMTLAKDPMIVRYLTMVKLLADGSAILERDKAQKMANRMECQIIRCCAEEDICPNKDDARIFLFAAVLFSDKNNLYDLETKEAFKVLCRIVQ